MDDLTLCHSLATQKAAIWRKAWKLLLDFGRVSGLTIPQHQCRLLALPRVAMETEIIPAFRAERDGGQVVISTTKTHWQLRGASIRTCNKVARFLPLPGNGEALIQYSSSANGLLL